MSDVHNPVTHIREQAERITALEAALREIARETYTDAVGDKWQTRAAEIAQEALTSRK